MSEQSRQLGVTTTRVGICGSSKGKGEAVLRRKPKVLWLTHRTGADISQYWLGMAMDDFTPEWTGLVLGMKLQLLVNPSRPISDS